jgi:hypothetical protein
MVQEPSTAKYDSMPRNAIGTVHADIVAPANLLPSRLIQFIEQIPVFRSGLETEVKDQSSLEKIIILLRPHTGNDFFLYKKNTLCTRIERWSCVHNKDRESSYVIIELSANLDILEFSPEAEFYFGITREETLNRIFFQMFVPVSSQKKIEKDLTRLNSEWPGGIIKMEVLIAGGDMKEVEWSASVLQNNLNKATGFFYN